MTSHRWTGIAVFVMFSVGIARAEMLPISGHNTITVCSGGQCGHDRGDFKGTLTLEQLTTDVCNAPQDCNYDDEKCRMCGTYQIQVPPPDVKAHGHRSFASLSPDPHCTLAGSGMSDAEGRITSTRLTKRGQLLRARLMPKDPDAYEESLKRCVRGLLKLSYSHRYTQRSRRGVPFRRTGSLTLRLRIRTGGRTLIVRDRAVYHVDP